MKHPELLVTAPHPAITAAAARAGATHGLSVSEIGPDVPWLEVHAGPRLVARACPAARTVLALAAHGGTAALARAMHWGHLRVTGRFDLETPELCALVHLADRDGAPAPSGLWTAEALRRRADAPDAAALAALWNEWHREEVAASEAAQPDPELAALMWAYPYLSQEECEDLL